MNPAAYKLSKALHVPYGVAEKFVAAGHSNPRQVQKISDADLLKLGFGDEQLAAFRRRKPKLDQLEA